MILNSLDFGQYVHNSPLRLSVAHQSSMHYSQSVSQRQRLEQWALWSLTATNPCNSLSYTGGWHPFGRGNGCRFGREMTQFPNWIVSQTKRQQGILGFSKFHVSRFHSNMMSLRFIVCSCCFRLTNPSLFPWDFMQNNKDKCMLNNPVLHHDRTKPMTSKYSTLGGNFNSAHSAGKVGPPEGLPHCPPSRGQPYCLKRRHIVYKGSHSPLCPDRFTSSSME